ncbi:MAG TPA: hypothetical protein VFR37_14645 [Longimicrobium sp.]|nr:hypothetical protein [Longimicrobium sp.]
MTPEPLPLIEHFLGSRSRHIDLSDVVIAAVQHIQGSTASMLNHFHQLGVPFSNMYVLGKSYSTHPAVMHLLGELGAYVHPGSTLFEAHRLTSDYREQLRIFAQEMLRRVMAELPRNRARRLLILDEGGIITPFARTCDMPVCAVEQTRSGARFLAGIDGLRFPIVNVAESGAKLEHETPLIAHTIIKALELRMAYHRPDLQLDGLRALIVGYGVIGEAVARSLRTAGATVSIHDEDQARMTVGREAGFAAPDLSVSGSQADVVIGCVGKSWPSEQLVDRLPNDALLACASSANVEFLGFLHTALKQNNGMFPEVEAGRSGLPWGHGDYVVEHARGKRSWLLNAGFPVNFDGSIDVIPPRLMQITRALMVAGAIQALEGDPRHGLVPLRADDQAFLVDSFYRMNPDQEEMYEWNSR